MDKNDMANFLKLDSKSKSGKKEKKGKYGIGSFNSNAVIGGLGVIRNITKDKTSTFLCEIHYDKLVDENVCPERAWTGDHQYKPNWVSVSGPEYEKYGCGFTQEFTNSKNAQFNLEELIPHIYIKYDNELSNGTKFNIKFGDQEFILNQPIFKTQYEKIEIPIKILHDNTHYFELNSKLYKVSKNVSGVITCRECNIHISDSHIKATPTVRVKYIEPSKISQITYNSEKITSSQENGWYCSKYVEGSMEHLLDIKLENQNQMIVLPCGFTLNICEEELNLEKLTFHVIFHIL